MKIVITASKASDLLPLALAFKDRDYSPIKHAVAQALRNAFTEPDFSEWWWVSEYSYSPGGPEGTFEEEQDQ